MAQHFADRGYAVVVVDYEYHYPSQAFIDPLTPQVACGLAWTYTHAGEYGIDPERIALFGDYQGATSAAWLAVADDPGVFLEGCPNSFPTGARVRGVSGYNGHSFTAEGIASWSLTVMGFGKQYQTLGEIGLVKLTRIFEELSDLSPQELREADGLTETEAKVAALLVETRIDGDEPPFLLTYPDVEGVGLDSECLARRLQAVGVQAEAFSIGAGFNEPTLGQNLGLEGRQVVYAAVEGFLGELFE
jgi:acetyl esterase/lipase